MPSDHPASSPVLILGMHRSGTGLLSSMLAELGLFVGKDLQADHESVFFIRINNWLLRQGQSTWDYPERYQVLIKHWGLLEKQVQQVRKFLNQGRLQRYAGKNKINDFRAGRLNQQWGWKDPRNTITLPVWLKLYPDLKIIHIQRHGVDVAESLVAREGRLARRIATMIKAIMLVWPRRHNGGLTRSPLRCTRLEGAFQVWELYNEQANQHVAALGDRAIQIKYEDFLQSPADILESICHFIGLTVDVTLIRNLVPAVRSDRAYAYRHSKELKQFAVIMDERLKIFGY